MSPSVERSSTSSDSSSGTQTKLHAHGVLRRRVVDRAHHRRERALHVVGAAADQPVALDARLELLLERGHHVEVAVQHDGRAVVRRRPRRGRPASRGARCRRPRLARLQPALDEPGRRVQPVGLGGVVGDQPLGEGAFVHAARIGSARAGRRRWRRECGGCLGSAPNGGRIVLFGATGYTGELTARAMVRRGARPVLAARARAWSELAAELGGLETSVADVHDPPSVAALVEEGDVLVTTVGPFTRWGEPALMAALTQRALPRRHRREHVRPPRLRVRRDRGRRARASGC